MEPERGPEDDDGELEASGPITQAVAANITKDHIDKGLSIFEKLVNAWSERGHSVNKTRLHWNYVTLLVISAFLSALTWVGKLPPEALTGFLGTAVGYWLASANRPTK